MTKRDSVLRTLRRQQPAEVPFNFSLCKALVEQFKEQHGHDNIAGHYGHFTRGVSLAPGALKKDFTKYTGSYPTNAYVDAWGVGHIHGSVAHFAHMLHPMAAMESPAEVEEYPFPDMDAPYRYEGLAEKVGAIQTAGFAAVAGMETTIFETAWYLRGMEQLLIDMYMDAEGNGPASVLLDRITALKKVMAAGYARAGVDIIRLGDDVGSQKGMLMDPALWRNWLKPRLAEVIAAAKQENRDVIIFYHSDGNILPIIPELIEIGVEVLNPVQPECMDPVELKDKFGDKLAFWGTIGTQTTMPFGTPEDVRREVKERIETVGVGGGLVLAPSHILEPEVPWANIEAFVAAVKEYGSNVN